VTKSKQIRRQSGEFTAYVTVALVVPIANYSVWSGIMCH